MTIKRFIETATQNSDDGKINHSVYDVANRNYHETSNELSTKKLCALLNELSDELEYFKKEYFELWVSEYSSSVEDEKMMYKEVFGREME